MYDINDMQNTIYDMYTLHTYYLFLWKGIESVLILLHVNVQFLYIGLVPVGFKGDSHGISICCKLQETGDMLISIRKKTHWRSLKIKHAFLLTVDLPASLLRQSKTMLETTSSTDALLDVEPHLSTHFPDLLNPKCSFTCIGTSVRQHFH